VLLTFSKGSTKVAINPWEVSDIQPHAHTPGWVLIRMKNGIEHLVEGEFDAVVAKLSAVS
jgi:hypothetical protein